MENKQFEICTKCKKCTYYIENGICVNRAEDVFESDTLFTEKCMGYYERKEGEKDV